MNIDLGNNLWIKSDERNFIITKYNGLDKHGKELWGNLGYYGTIEGLFMGLRDHKLRTEDITSIAAIGRVIRDSDKQLTEGLAMADHIPDATKKVNSNTHKES